MLACAGTAVTVGNACEELKGIADKVCESVENNGIYHELKRMGIIE